MQRRKPDEAHRHNRNGGGHRFLPPRTCSKRSSARPLRIDRPPVSVAAPFGLGIRSFGQIRLRFFRCGMRSNRYRTALLDSRAVNSHDDYRSICLRRGHSE